MGSGIVARQGWISSNLLDSARGSTMPPPHTLAWAGIAHFQHWPLGGPDQILMVPLPPRLEFGVRRKVTAQQAGQGHADLLRAGVIPPVGIDQPEPRARGGDVPARKLPAIAQRIALCRHADADAPVHGRTKHKARSGDRFGPHALVGFPKPVLM